MEVIEQLQQLGFSQYEAQAYVALLRENPLNGYALAKASGVPRANIYHVLDKLEEAGAVMRLTVADGLQYAPVPAEELLLKRKRRFEQSLEAASTSLQQIAAPTHLESVLNIRGYGKLLAQAETLLDQTREHLLLSIWPEEALALAAPVRQAAERGVKITTLCLRGCPQPCPACQGTVFRYALAPQNTASGHFRTRWHFRARPYFRTRWLVLVSDENELLAGEVVTSLAPGSEEPAGADVRAGAEVPAVSDSMAVRTRQPMLVSLTGSYIQNSIALASILTHLGKRLQTELDPETLSALNSLHAPGEQRAWLEAMQQMLHPGQHEP